MKSLACAGISGDGSHLMICVGVECHFLPGICRLAWKEDYHMLHTWYTALCRSILFSEQEVRKRIDSIFPAQLMACLPACCDHMAV